jgi:hypothetical protein
MALIIAGQRGRVWRNIGDICITRRLVRRHSWTNDPLKTV